jgi:hypothetical protein
MPRPALLPSGAADDLGPEASSTYHICRDFEQRAIIKGDDSCDAMHARILVVQFGTARPGRLEPERVIAAAHARGSSISSFKLFRFRSPASAAKSLKTDAFRFFIPLAPI